MTAASALEPSRRLGTILAGGLASLLAACSTTYRPTRPDRVAMVIQHGAPAYVKNGQVFPIGPFSGPLEGLVGEVPAAVAHARTARTQLTVGVPAYLVGLGGVVLGIVLLSGPVGWVVIGLGSASAGTGLGLMGAGVTHAVDAVNIHNDQLDGRDRAPEVPR